ncbi:MAG: hypothetical protein U1E73_08420 [Planctomycetota bacterium]
MVNVARWFVAGVLGVAAGAQTAPQLWVYCSFNLLVDGQVEALAGVMRRAAAAGYSHVLLADSKFGRLADMERRYFDHVERVKALAAELHLELVPAVFPIGYSEAILSRDPNLAEGLPVEGAKLVVRGGEARIAADPPVSLRGGDFADLGAWDWHDDCVGNDGGAAHVRDFAGNARVVQKVRVAPCRQYHVSVRVKTRDFRAEPRVAVLAGEHSFNFADLGVKPTQDWTLHHVVFNSLEHDEVALYFGAWGGGTGELWWDDARIEEVALLNVVRRAGAPLVVKHGRKALVEGRDFEAVADPRMGTVPWPGGYEVWHEPPVLRTKGLRDGAELRVSYCHAITVHDGQVMICPSEPKTLAILKDHMARVHAAFGARGYFLSHDEIRVLGRDAACRDRHLDAGGILAQNLRDCTRIAREVAPHARLYVWSDMFDPNHNATKDYYLVRGDLAGSWDGLEKSVVVAAWYFEKRDASLAFFHARGNPLLLAGYYDADPQQVRGWLDAAKAIGGAEAVMYTTWRSNYDDLEAFAQVVRAYR